MLQQILSFLRTPLTNEELEKHSNIIQTLASIKEASFPTFTRPTHPHPRRNHHSRKTNSRKRHHGFVRNINKPTANGFARNQNSGDSGNAAATAGAGGGKPNNWRENRYISMYSKKANDDNEKHLNSITDKLGKITNDNFEEFSGDIRQDLSKVDENTVKKFVNEIFNRAAMQPIFCGLYVRVLNVCISIPNVQRYISEIIDDYLRLFNTKMTEISADNYEEYCQNNKEKDYRIGYSSFIGELLGYNLVNPGVVYRFAMTIFELVKKETELETCSKANVQDNVGCFKNLIMRLMNTEGDEVATMKDELKAVIAEYLSLGRAVLRKKIGMKSIFDLEDLGKL
jgi:hypothetical protein